MSLKAIVAVEENWGIGCAGRLLVHVADDLRYFKERTRSCIVIMGRKTLDSLPNPMKGLPGRENWILSRSTRLDSDESLRFFTSKESILAALEERGDVDAWIIGGASIYQDFLMDCKEIWVSRLQYRAQQVDVFFPNLDEDPRWVLHSSEERMDQGSGIAFSICCYRRRESC